MALSFRVSSTTSNGTANATSLGGYAAATGPSTTSGSFFHSTTAAQNDAGHTDYLCLFVYNGGTTDMNNVKVSVSNKGGGATVTVALSSVAMNTLASYNTAVIANETTAPSITGSFTTSVTIGDMVVGQVKAVWLKRVVTTNTAAATGDTFTVVASGTEVIV